MYNIAYTHECERACCVRGKVASCCSNAMMAGVLADFCTKDHTVRLVRPSFWSGGAAAGPLAHACADIDEEGAPLRSGRPSFVS